MYLVSWKKQLILAVILAVGGYAIYWQEYNRRPKKEEAEENTKKPFVLKDVQVSEIKITDPDSKKNFTFRCLDLAAKLCKAADQSKWELIEPFRGPADSGNINSLLSSLNNTTSTEIIDLKADSPERRASLLKDYELFSENRSKTTARRLDLKLADGKLQTLYLGATNPIDQGVFALRSRDGTVNEEQVLILPAGFISQLEHNPTYWRDKKLVTLESSKVTGFSLKGRKDTIKAVKSPEGQWTLSSRIQAGSHPGDPENVGSVITTAGYLSAKEFVEKSVLSGAQSVLEITFQETDPVTLRFFEKAPKNKSETKKIFATVSRTQLVYELESNAIERLDKSLKDLRMTRLLSTLDRFAVKKIEIKGKPFGESLLLAQEDNQWFLSPLNQPKQKHAADSEKVLSLLDKVSGNRIQDFVEGSKIPAGQAEGIELKFMDPQGQVKRNILFWTRDLKLYAKDLDSKRNEAFLIDTTLSMALPWSKDFFEKKAAVPTPQETATHP